MSSGTSDTLSRKLVDLVDSEIGDDAGSRRYLLESLEMAKRTGVSEEELMRQLQDKNQLGATLLGELMGPDATSSMYAEQALKGAMMYETSLGLQHGFKGYLRSMTGTAGHVQEEGHKESPAKRQAVCMIMGHLCKEYKERALQKFYELMAYCHKRATSKVMNSKMVECDSDFDWMDEYEDCECNGVYFFLRMEGWWIMCVKESIAQEKAERAMSNDALMLCDQDPVLKILLRDSKRLFDKVNPTIYLRVEELIRRKVLTVAVLNALWDRSKHDFGEFFSMFQKEVQRMMENVDENKISAFVSEHARNYAPQWKMHNVRYQRNLAKEQMRENSQSADESKAALARVVSTTQMQFLHLWSILIDNMRSPTLQTKIPSRSDLKSVPNVSQRCFLMALAFSRIEPACEVMLAAVSSVCCYKEVSEYLQDNWFVIHSLYILQRHEEAGGSASDDPKTILRGYVDPSNKFYEFLVVTLTGVCKWKPESRIINLAKAFGIAAMFMDLDSFSAVFSTIGYRKYVRALVEFRKFMNENREDLALLQHIQEMAEEMGQARQAPPGEQSQEVSAAETDTG